MIKKFSYAGALSAAGLILFLASCTPTPVVNPPIVTVNPETAVTASPGATVNYEVIVSSDTDLSKVEMSGKSGSTVLFAEDTTFAAGVQAAIVNFVANIPGTVVAGTTLTVDFTAYNEGETTTVTRTINVVAGEINTYTAVIMSDLENPNGSSFLSVDSGTLMTLNQAIATPAKVDILYYYGNTNQASLCAPTDQAVRAFTDAQNRIIVDRLTTKNDTKLASVTMTPADFTAVTNDGPIIAKKPATTATSVTKLAKDNVLYCQTVTGKMALILVKNITGTQGTSYITIEVKVQK
jgi:hypothetical protein